MKNKTEAQLRGSGWVAFVDKDFDEWDFEGDRSGWPIVKMLNDHFSRDVMEFHKSETMVWGREYGMLFPLAAEFLGTWGIKCKVENLPPVTPEAPPLPKD